MKKLLILILTTASLTAMDHTSERMAFSFILNSDGTPTMHDSIVVGQKRSRSPLDESARLENAPRAKRICPTQKAYTCPELGCPYATTDCSNFKRHMRRHNNERRYKCPYSPCLYDTPDRSDLKKHIHSHTAEKPAKQAKSQVVSMLPPIAATLKNIYRAYIKKCSQAKPLSPAEFLMPEPGRKNTVCNESTRS